MEGCEGVVSVSEYLERARECAALAEKMTGDDKTRMLAVAQAWLKVAEEATKLADAAKPGGNRSIRQADSDPSRSESLL
jgi:hypothetical protein